MSEDADKIIEVFKTFDQDSDGVIDRQELATILKRLDGSWDSGTIQDLLNTVGRNKDGKIQYVEFVHWLTEGGAFSDVMWAAVTTGHNLPSGAEPRLQAIAKMSPHLARNPTYKEAMEALAVGDEDAAFLLSDRLLLQIQCDWRRIEAAFLKFDYDGTGSLDASEMRAMFIYLGFPDPEEDSDVKVMLQKLDRDGNGRVEQGSFQEFV